MRTVEWKGGESDGLRVDVQEDVDVETFIDLVRSAMYFHIKKDPPEIVEARKVMESVSK